MGIITLTPKERNKFIGWLQQELSPTVYLSNK